MKKSFLIIFTLAILLIVPSIHAHAVCDPNSNEICNPIGDSDQTLPDFVGFIMRQVGNIIGLIAIVMLVYAGVRFLISNGDPAKIKEAKSSLTYTVTGFVISVMAYAGILAVENFIGVQTLDPGQIDEPFNPFKLALPGLVSKVLVNTMLLCGIVAIFMIVLNGFRYMTARGNDDQIKLAKSGLTWSLLGLVIILFAYVIISAIANLLG
jgi:hypothetical protein